MSASLVLLLLLLGATDEEAPAPPIGVQRLEANGASVISAVLPGSVTGWTQPAGRELLVFTSQPEEGPARVSLLSNGASPELTQLDLELPEGPAPLLDVDLDGDGRREPLLGGPERILSLDPNGGAPREILDRPLLFLPRSARTPEWTGSPQPALLELGELVPLRVADGSLQPGEPLELPLHAQRRSSGLLLESPPITELPRPGRSPLYLVGPEAHGQRLRTLLLDPEAPADEREQESWALLPGPETVLSSWYALIRGRLRLVVTTAPSDRLDIFGEQSLRLFSVIPDRTRGGRSAQLQVATETSRWNPVEVALADVDVDGTEELVVLQPEGMGGGDLVLSAYSTSYFTAAPRRSKIDDVGCFAYGQDVDGDRLPDLVTFEHGTLRLYPGNGQRKKRSVVEKNATKTIELAADFGDRETTVTLSDEGMDWDDGYHCGLYLVPFEGADRASILTVTADRGRGRVRVLRLD